MMKIKHIIIACLLALSTNYSTAQSYHGKAITLMPEQIAKLSTQFKQYDIIEIDLKTLEDNIAIKNKNITLALTVADEPLVLQLFPNEIRASNYLLSFSQPDQNAMSKGNYTTLKGTVKGDSESDIRLTIGKYMFKGYVMTNGQFYYFDSVNKFIQDSEKNQIIVYRREDITNWSERMCAFDAEEEQSYLNQSLAQSSQSPSTSCRILELATETDYEYFLDYAGPLGPGANNEIIALINMIQGLYLTTFDINVIVVYQHVWTTSSDPYTKIPSTHEPNAPLIEFRDYWNSNFAHIKRDVSMLFIGKDGGALAGKANTGSTCNDPTNAYVYVVDGTSMDQTVAHELAHMIGGKHSDARNCDPFAGSIMCTVSPTASPSYFSSASVTRINNWLNANDACFFDFDYIDITSTDNIVCNNEIQTFTFEPLLSIIDPDLFSNNTLLWSVSNSNLSILSGGSAKTVTVKGKATGGGSCTLTATYTSPDFGCDLVEYITVAVGAPIKDDIDIRVSDSSGPVSYPYEDDLIEFDVYEYYVLEPDGFTNISSQNIDQLDWDVYGSNISTFTSSLDGVTNAILNISASAETSGDIELRFHNSCGWSNTKSYVFEAYDNGYFSFYMLPNPAEDELTISFERSKGESSEKTTTSGTLSAQAEIPVQVQVLDHGQNQVLQSTSFLSEGDLKLNTTSLKPGSYIVHIIIEGEVHKKHLLIQ